MFYQTKTAPLEALEMLGDLHPLLEQLGSADGLVTLAGAADSLAIMRVESLPALRDFLRNYHSRILAAHELPAIQGAFLRASRNEVRELVELDGAIANEPALQHFLSPSRRVGRAQLQRLRPLRDQRIVKRYLAAVDDGRAQGWHTLVYGLTLAVYSLPLRQGLVGYARQTTRGFIHAACAELRFSRVESDELFAELTAPLPAIIDGLLAPTLT